MAVPTDRVARILGLRPGIRSVADIAEAVESGLPKQSLERVVERAGVEGPARAKLMHRVVPAATYKRRHRLKLVEGELYPALAERRTRMPCEPPGARAATLNFNSVHGGEPEPGDANPAPVVADSCRLVLDRRYLVEEDLEAVKAEIVALLERTRAGRSGIDYALREVMTFAPTMTEPDAPVVRALDHFIHQVFAKPSTHIASPGTYDQKHIDRIGRLHNCIAYGPGILDLAHQPDEYVGITDMLDSAKVMGSALADLLVAS